MAKSPTPVKVYNCEWVSLRCHRLLQKYFHCLCTPLGIEIVNKRKWQEGNRCHCLRIYCYYFASNQIWNLWQEIICIKQLKTTCKLDSHTHLWRKSSVYHRSSWGLVIIACIDKLWEYDEVWELASNNEYIDFDFLIR